ncbi:MAG: 4-amino-4-deoxychorismate lyase [Thermoleophilia bacterium]
MARRFPLTSCCRAHERLPCPTATPARSACSCSWRATQGAGGGGGAGAVTLLAVAVLGRGLVDPDQPVVHADDEGFLRGRGVFETVRVYRGRPFRLDDHLARLSQSAERLGLRQPQKAELQDLVAQAVEAAGAGEAMLRVYLTPGREGSGTPLALALVASLPPDLEQMRSRGLRLASVALGVEPGTWPLGGIKSTSYAVNMLALDEARRRGADDAVFLALGGILLEGPTTNVWWRRGRTLFTPALDLGILAGVTRAVVMEAASGLGYEVREGAFPLEELLSAEEAFTSSSVREIMPVVSVDGRPVGDGSPGQAAAAFQRALRQAAAA